MSLNPTTSERLYRRLPQIFRRRDREHGEPLRALLAVIERELRILEDDVEGLYENAFIETCQDWVVPYIADLLGVRVLGEPPYAGADPRAQVANALAFRDRKGTPVVLERTIHDILGWFARVVEYFDFLAHTQNVNFVRPDRGGFFDLDRAGDLAEPGDPFEPPIAFHNVDVRRIASERGRFNVPNLGIFLWRLRAFPADDAPAAAAGVAGGFHFDPLGRDVPLFNRPVVPTELVRAAEEHQLPVPINRDAMAENPDLYYGRDRAVHVRADGKDFSVDEVLVADLGSWTAVFPVPPAPETPPTVAVDPELGRILFKDAPADPTSVRVRYSYGFNSPMAGGPYDRRQTLTEEDDVALVLRVAKDGQYTTLQAAVDVWSAQGRPDAAIRVEDSEIYVEDVLVTLPAQGRLAIEAADGVRPVLRPASFRVAGNSADSELAINGFWIDGVLELEDTVRLLVTHCTLVPRAGRSSMTHTGDASELRVRVTFSITGSLELPVDLADLVVEDSILDGASGGAVAVPVLVSDQRSAVSIQKRLRLEATRDGVVESVELDAVPVDLADARTRLENALTPDFTGAAVVDLGTRLLVRSGVVARPFTFAPLGTDSTAIELGLVVPPAELVTGLFSGRHRGFLPFSRPVFEVTLGGIGPRTVTLTEIPGIAQLDAVAQLLQDALRAAGDEPTWRDVEVVAVDGKLLLVRPGVAGDAVVFNDFPSNSAANDLGLLTPPAAPADGVFSDFPDFTGFDHPKMQGTIGAAGPVQVDVNQPAGTVAEAAVALQDAIDNAAGLPAGTTVTDLGTRLLVAPALATDVVQFAGHVDDPATVADLALLEPPAESIRGRLSGALTEPLGISGAAVVATLDGESQTLTFAHVPGPDNVRDLLEQSLRAASASPAFRDAVVLALGRELLVMPGVDGVTVSFADDGTDPTATEMGLAGGTALEGLVSGNLAPFPSFSPPELEVRIGGGTYETVAFDGLPTTPATAGAQLRDALGRVAGNPSFEQAAVVVLGDDRLLVISGVTDEDLSIRALAGDLYTAGELELEDPPARMVDALLSGSLDPFPAFPGPAVDVTFGPVGPVEVMLTIVPQTIDEARQALEDALRGADSDATFQSAEVLVVGTRLLVRPGTPGHAVDVAATAGDPTSAGELGLVEPPAEDVEGVLSGDLAAFPTFPLPVVRVDLGTGPLAVGLPVTPPDTVPTDVATARAALAAGLTNAGVAATAVQAGNRLLVRSQPLDVTTTVVLSAGAGDPDTVEDLGLGTAARAVSGRLSGDLSTFTPIPAGRSITVTIDGTPATANITNPINDLTDAQVELQAAIQGAGAGTDFTNATVTIVDDRLLVEPGNPGKLITMVDNIGTPATDLKLTDALSEAAYGALSGDLPTFALTLRPRIDVTQGGVPRTALFDAVPTTLDEARTLLENAFQNEFPGAVVRRLGDFLLAEPGTAGQSLSFADGGAGPATATLLKLDAASSQRGDGLLSSGFTPLTFAQLKMEATIGGLTREVVVAKPFDLAEARQYLQDAVRNAHAYNGFAQARVGILGDQLVVVPGVADATVRFSAHGDSPSVVTQFQLAAASATPIRGLLSGDLAPTFTLTRTPALNVSLHDSAAVRATFTDLPTGVDDAAELLAEAVRTAAADPLLTPAEQPYFQNVEVEASGDRIVVIAASDPADPTTRTEQIVFTNTTPGFATASLLSLVAGIATVGQLGLLSKFITAATPEVEITVGAGPATTLNLTPPITNFTQAATAIETAWGGGRVRNVDGELLVLPATPTDTVVFDTTAGDPTSAVQLGLVPSAARAVKGWLSGVLADPLAALTADAALDVTLGARGPVTVVLGTLTDLSLDNVRERLEEALRAADGSTEFTAARVIRVDDQLLILSGNDGDTVTVAAAAANPATVAELMLDAAGGAVLTEGLINGELRLTRTPAFDLTMTAVPGPGTDTRRVTLATFPQTLDEARSAVENGIQRVGVAVSSPAFTGAVVRVVDDRLLVTPGAGNVTVDPFAETGIGPDTAAELKLAAADSLAADGLLSGDLSAFTGLSFVTYEIQVTIGGAGPYTRQLSSGPGDLPAAAVVLQAAIRDNAVEDTFRNATVTANLTLGRLLITPGNPRDAVAFAATPADADTAANLGLDNLMPAGGLLGGVPNSFATLDLEITLGPDVRTLEMTAPPQTLDEAATLLQQAIRDADPAHPSFSGARVRVVDDRLLVTSGDAGESVAFTVPNSTVSRLKLDAPSAVVAGDDALLSGNLEAFPAFPAGPAVDVRIGDEGPNTAVLATTPTTLAEARDSLEAAIRAARSSPSFHNARVEIAGDRLVVVPGLPEEVTITATVDDATTVDDLGFVSGVRRVGALLSGRLGATVHFTDDAPQIIARMFPGPTELTLDLGALLPFADLAAVRDQLRARLRNGPGAAFQNAEVIVLDGEALLIVPGEDGARIELDNTLNDPTTLADLALALGQAVGTQDNLGPPMSLLRTTVFGRLHLQEIVLASEVLFTQTLEVERPHVGCVRFCYLPPGSACPRRFRSQPELAVELAVRTALEARTRQLGLAAVDRLDPGERAAIEAGERARVLSRLVPRFTAAVFGRPGYAQLSLDAAAELGTGAEDGSEIGAFNHLHEPRRRSQMRELLSEFLRFGLDAGIFEMT